MYMGGGGAMENKSCPEGSTVYTSSCSDPLCYRTPSIGFRHPPSLGRKGAGKRGLARAYTVEPDVKIQVPVNVTTETFVSGSQNVEIQTSGFCQGLGLAFDLCSLGDDPSPHE